MNQNISDPDSCLVNICQSQTAGPQEKEEAFRKIVNKYKEKIYNYCNDFLHNEQDAEAVASTILSKAGNKIDTFKGKSIIGEDTNFSRWLYKIAKNTCINFEKKRKRNPANPGKIDFADTIPDSDTSLEDKIIVQMERENEAKMEKEVGAKIKNILLSSKDDKFKALYLFYFKKLKLKEVANTLNLDPDKEKALNMAKSYIYRSGVNELKEILKEEMPKEFNALSDADF